jgi:hypothetical protein
MLNITQGNPVPLGIQLRRNGADFAPESEGLRVLLTDYYGSREVEDVTVADGRILATVPATVRVGKYGIEITGTQAGSPWRTKYNDVLNITDDTVEDVSDEPVTMTGDYYDIVLTVNLYGGGESAELLEELERLRGEVVTLNGELAEKDTVIAQKDAVIGEKDAVIAQKDEVISGKDEVISGLEGDLQESLQQLSDMTDERDKATLFIGSYLGGGTDIEVPGRGELNIRYGTLEVPAGFTEIGDGVFRQRSDIERVDLGDVEALDTYNFNGSTSIISVRGENVRTLNGYNFGTCPCLSEVDFPNLESCDTYEFNGCTTLETISLPNLLIMKGQGVFLGCRALKNVYLPKLHTAGQRAFMNCSSLEELSLPLLESIPSAMFSGCDMLKKLEFHELESISSIINYPSIEVIIIDRNDVTSLSNPSYINSTCTVYVPDELVDVYKAATNWKNHASQIKGLSEYVED